jgi:hypothetical protein
MHDLFRKPVSTFRDHALDARACALSGPVAMIAGRCGRRIACIWPAIGALP